VGGAGAEEHAARCRLPSARAQLAIPTHVRAGALLSPLWSHSPAPRPNDGGRARPLKAHVTIGGSRAVCVWHRPTDEDGGAM
jgi:hypothetical protein